jgi:hypothetical protein
VPFAVNEVLLITVGSTILIASILESVCPWVLEAVIVTEVLPDCVGVPLITPVVALMVSPSGKGDAVKLVGEFVADIL